jgi:hypothetical protein
MRTGLVLSLFLVSGCGSIFNGPGGKVLAEGLFHAFVTAPLVVGAAAANAAIEASQRWEIEEAERPKTASAEQKPCNYWLRCNARECYFETSDGLVVTCEGWDCRDHAPAQLKAWCPK